MKAVTLHREQIYGGSLLLVNSRYPLRQIIPPEQIRPLEQRTVQTFPEQKPAPTHPEIFLERKTALVLETLFATIGSGSSLLPVSGFRTRKEQEDLYASSLQDHGTAFTESYVALPGHSEHETGLAIDLALNREPVDFLRPYFPRDGICGRFRQKAASYGFVERYPEGKEPLTGIAPEPWHFRYVGLPHASIMETHGFCLEEYLDYLKEFPYEGRHLMVRIENKSFEIFYKKAEGDSTELTLPGYLPFQVSGDNREGFLFTLWR